MEKYIPGSGPSPAPTFSLDEQFGELELIGTMMQYKELGKRVIDRIGIGGSILAMPFVYRENVFFGCCDKNFYCLDLDGKERWRFPTNSMVYNNHGAAFRGNVVFFTSMDGCLYAVNADSGKLLWKFKTGGPIIADPRTDQERVYFSSSDGNFYAVGADSGKLEWKSELGTETGVPSVQKDRVYLSGLNGIFYCLDKSGRVIWKFRLKGEMTTHPPVISGNRIYFGSFDKILYCLNTDGRLEWTFKCNDVAYTPVLFDGRLYFGSRDFCVYCVNAETGRLLWKFRAAGMVPIVSASGSSIYFGSWDNNVYCLNAQSGELIWKFPTRGFATGTSVHEGRVYAGSWDCNLYCLDAETGKLIWKFKTSLGTPSQIEPPETGMLKTVEVIWSAPPEEEKDKYKTQPGTGEYSINMSRYAVTSEYVQSSPYKARKREF